MVSILEFYSSEFNFPLIICSDGAPLQHSMPDLTSNYRKPAKRPLSKIKSMFKKRSTSPIDLGAGSGNDKYY